MPVRPPQAIRGVSASGEAPLEEVYPSIAMTGLGRALDQLYGLIPQGYGRVKLSYLLFVPPTIPLALGAYLALKAFGEYYAVTNRSVRRVRIVGGETVQQVALEDIQEIVIDADTRSDFFRTADVRLNDALGQTLLELRGVPYPERMVSVIRDAQTSRRQVASALATINARSPR